MLFRSHNHPLNSAKNPQKAKETQQCLRSSIRADPQQGDLSRRKQDNDQFARCSACQSQARRSAVNRSVSRWSSLSRCENGANAPYALRTGPTGPALGRLVPLGRFWKGETPSGGFRTAVHSICMASDTHCRDDCRVLFVLQRTSTFRNRPNRPSVGPIGPVLQIHRAPAVGLNTP